MEVYFNVLESRWKAGNYIFPLEARGHTFAWWESDTTKRNLEDEPLAFDWKISKRMIQSQLLSIGYEKKQ